MDGRLCCIAFATKLRVEALIFWCLFIYFAVEYLLEFGPAALIFFAVVCLLLVWLPTKLSVFFLLQQAVKLKAFSKFENISEALSAAILIFDGKPSKDLCKFLRAHCDGETLS